MHNFYMPNYMTREEILKARRERIASSGAYNTEQALEWLEQNPDIELIWVDLEDVYFSIGIKSPTQEENYVHRGWLYRYEDLKKGINFEGRYAEIKDRNEGLSGLVFDLENERRFI